MDSGENLTIPLNESIIVNISSEMPLDYAIPLYGYCMPFLLVVTIVCNTLIVMVLSQKHMRTPTNTVLLAMAICDLLTLVFPAPWFIYMYTFGFYAVPMGSTTVCYLWGVFHETIPNMFHTISIWLTVELAIQRYIYVCHPPMARRFCTLKNAYKWIPITVFGAVIHQGPRLFDMDYKMVDMEWNNQTIKVCSKSSAMWVQQYITIDVYYIMYFLFRLFFIHLGPCISLVTLNGLLFRALKTAQKRRDLLLNTNNTSNPNDCRRQRDANCTTLMLIVVVTVFLIVEIPLAVVTLLHIISSSIVEFLDYEMTSKLIVLINFFIILSFPFNFAIYCGMSRQFQETFMELFCSKRSAPVQPTSRYSAVTGGTRTCTNETIL